MVSRNTRSPSRCSRPAAWRRNRCSHTITRSTRSARHSSLQQTRKARTRSRYWCTRTDEVFGYRNMPFSHCQAAEWRCPTGARRRRGSGRWPREPSFPPTRGGKAATGGRKEGFFGGQSPHTSQLRNSYSILEQQEHIVQTTPTHDRVSEFVQACEAELRGE